MSEPAPTAGPARGLEDLGRCPVCGVAERVTLHEGLTDRAFGVAPGRWSMRSRSRLRLVSSAARSQSMRHWLLHDSLSQGSTGRFRQLRLDRSSCV